MNVKRDFIWNAVCVIEYNLDFFCFIQERLLIKKDFYAQNPKSYSLHTHGRQENEQEVHVLITETPLLPFPFSYCT